MAAATVEHHLRPGTLQLPALPPLALYVHLPWCLTKCPYCDFNSHEIRPKALPEAALPRRAARRPRGGAAAGLGPPRGAACSSAAARRACSRPTAIDGADLERARLLPLEPGCEITLEANPGTFERERFRAFARAGVNRLSIGVQSFDDTLLKRIGRVHDAAQARAAVQEASEAFEHLQHRPDVCAAAADAGSSCTATSTRRWPSSRRTCRCTT